MCIFIIIRVRYVYLFVLLYKSPGKVTQHLSNAPTRSDRFTCTPITAPIRYNNTRRFLLLHRWPDVISVAFRPRAGIKIPKNLLKSIHFWGDFKLSLVYSIFSFHGLFPLSWYIFILMKNLARDGHSSKRRRPKFDYSVL